MSDTPSTGAENIAPLGETPERLARHLEKENQWQARRREDDLDGSLAPFRVGSVCYLNSVPLTRGLEDQVHFHTPSQLAQMLRARKLDAALVSLSEVIFSGAYDVLDGVAIASLGEIKSVHLAHRQPLQEMQEVYLDTASLSSVTLLKVLLAERGLRPEFKPLANYEDAPGKQNVLLIGDPALQFLRAGHPHAIFDLGAAWYEMTRLPFVFAVWALRRDIDTTPLRRHLREAKAFGLETLDAIIQSRTEFDYEFRKDYLSWHVHYHLGTDEKRGIAKFIELLRKHDSRPAHDLHYVS